VKSVLGSFDVIDVQDSGGSGYEQPSDIKNWFTALHKALAGTSSALWDDPDMFSATNHGGPMTPTQLQANLKAASGQVSAYSGFSFTTQMDPNLIGTSAVSGAGVRPGRLTGPGEPPRSAGSACAGSGPGRPG
jgi:hypothetical protein